MAKKHLGKVFLMVKDPDDIMKDYVWVTEKELTKYKKLGYKRLKKGK